MKKDEVIEFVKSLKGYDGYIQFSDKKIDENDIFISREIEVSEKDNFIYEAHFCNQKESISIKQINDKWFVTKTDISQVEENDIDIVFGDIKNIKMAQIWEIEKDDLCEGLEVKKLKKVVFAGFEGEKK